ncbi:MAG: hypothetical protein WCG99_02825 [Candidatus Berkelbacteria bacterium]
MRGVLIGALIGLLIGVMFILFSSLYSSYAATNEVAAALTTIFLWIIFGGIVAVILELSFKRK